MRAACALAMPAVAIALSACLSPPAGDPAGCVPLLEDPFDGQTLDASRWDTPGGAGGITVAGGALSLRADATSDEAEARVLSLDAHDVTGTELVAAFTSSAAPGGDDGIEWLHDSTDHFGVEVEDGALVASYGTPDQGEQQACLDCPPYDPARQRFIRLRADATTIYFEYSKDGAGWTPLGQAPRAGASYAAHMFSFAPPSQSDPSHLSVDQITWSPCDGDATE